MLIQEMAKKFSEDQRKVLAVKLMEWGNLVFVGLVIAQFVPESPSFVFNGPLIAWGCLGITAAYIAGLLLLGEEGGDRP